MEREINAANLQVGDVLIIGQGIAYPVEAIAVVGWTLNIKLQHIIYPITVPYRGNRVKSPGELLTIIK